MLAGDIINSATPLENDLLGVHPRLYINAETFERLRRPDQPPNIRNAIGSLISIATHTLTRPCPDSADVDGDHRGVGTNLPSQALAWRITDDRRYLDITLDYMRALGRWQDWGIDLEFGHIAHGYAVALDWIWHDITDAKRQTFIEALYRNVTVLFDEWRSCHSGPWFCYTCNHYTVALSGLTAAGSVLYGEHPNISPWLNMATEKVRATVAALDPDGVSPEGVAYGGYYSHNLMHNLLLLRDLCGVDLLKNNVWFRQHPTALIHHTLPRRHWSETSTFMMLGDTYGSHWYGPDPVAAICAAVFNDRHAQWLADAVVEDNVSCTQGDRIMSLASMTTKVQPQPPDDLPTFKYFEDHGISIGRSDWSGDESVWSFRSGPPMGKTGHLSHRNPIAGGHMHAFAGTFQIFSHGEAIVPFAGYTQKLTNYHNTILVNDAGQLGESLHWYEDLPYRYSQQFPSMQVVASGDSYQHVMADAAHAYPEDLGLRRFTRHMMYVKPDIWVIVDFLGADRPATFTQCIHTGFPLKPRDAGDLYGDGTTAAMAIRTVQEMAVTYGQESQDMRYTGGNVTHTQNLLRISNAERTADMVFVTLITAGAKGDELAADILTARVTPEEVSLQFSIADRADPIVVRP